MRNGYCSFVFLVIVSFVRLLVYKIALSGEEYKWIVCSVTANSSSSSSSSSSTV